MNRIKNDKIKIIITKSMALFFVFFVFFFPQILLQASEENVPCPACGFQNTQDDRYCVKCMEEIRSITEEDKKELFEKRKEKVFVSYEKAKDNLFKAQNTTNRLTSKKHYEMAGSYARKALSEGGRNLSPQLKKDLERIAWIAKENVSALREILKNPYSRVKMKKVRSSYYVDVVLNKKVEAKLHLDTGCSSTLLSPEIAEKLKIEGGQEIETVLADGTKVKAKKAFLNTIKVGEQTIRNVPVVIMETSGDGLLGMSFLKYFKFQVDTKTDELVLQRR